MRWGWAIFWGAAIGIGLAWWLSRESAEEAAIHRARAEQAAAELAEKDLCPLYRWRDTQDTLHITDQAPSNRPYERIAINSENRIHVCSQHPGR